MPLILPGNVASATAVAGYSIANSCRFNAADVAYMHKTASAGNRKTWTFSTWIKRGIVSTQQFWGIGDANTTNDNIIIWNFQDSAKINMYDYNGGISGQLITTQVFRDPSAWYHFVLGVDTTQGTAGNRMKLYVNGIRITAFDTETQPAEDYEFNINVADKALTMGVYNYGSLGSPVDAYYADTVFIDGTQYAASDFGEFNEDSPTIWQPKDVSELTFGTNGFWLNYEDSANLGNDANGGTDLTEVNLTASDQSTDTPTNNFCVMNPLNDVLLSGHNFTEGNTVVNVASGERASSFGTIGMTKGKWYVEMKLTNASGHDFLGIAGKGNSSSTDQLGWNDYQWSYYSATGKYAHDAAEISFSGGDNTWGVNDIIGLAIDLDSDPNTLKWHKNGTYQSDVTLDENASATDWGAWFFACGSGTGSNDSAYAMNFGNPSYANSSSAADENGYGDFEYAPPSGYLALCTKNLGSDGG